MVKAVNLGTRVRPEVKAAIDKAAKDRLMSSSGFVQQVMLEWLKANGYWNFPQGKE